VQPGAAPPGAAGASPAYATKPAIKATAASNAPGGLPRARIGPGQAASPNPPPVAAAPPPAQASARKNDDIEIELDMGGGAPNNGAIEIGDDGLADAEAALEAMQSFRMAEAALQRNDVANALRLAQKAVEGDPSQADYVTLLAWISALGGHPASIEDAIATMTRVLGDDPSSEKALLYRGKLLVRTNRLQEALADFNELLRSNPQHREAQAELRQLKTRM
jgi:tetratricopeptide (TPR) repeat protein